MDIIRYAPQILHIALVRSYYATFPIELEELRKKIGVIGRKDEMYQEHYILKKHIYVLKVFYLLISILNQLHLYPIHPFVYENIENKSTSPILV